VKLESSLVNYFPPGFSPRPQQERGLNLIEEAINKGVKFIIVQAPTGSGKSFISKTLGNASAEADKDYKDLVLNYHAYDKDYEEIMPKKPIHGCFALTTTIALQDQYKQLFDDAVLFKGKSNYQCDVDNEFTVEQAPCLIANNLKRSCWNEHRCPYYENRNKALTEKFTVLNYASFFNLPNHLKKRQIIVADECSELEDEIVKFYSATIEYEKLAKVGIDSTKLTTEDPKPVLGWLTDLAEETKAAIDLGAYKQRNQNSKIELNKQQYRKELYDAITSIIDNWDNTQYIIEKDGDKATFTPLKIDRLTGCLFDFADVVILMSATIVDKKAFANTLGITKYEYIEFESTFDPKKSPIHCHTKYPLNQALKQKNLPFVIDLAKSIAEHHKGKKGIIHTHSHEITKELQRSLNGNRFLFREGGAKNAPIIFEHKTRKDDTVLVSPSLTMGLDLVGDLGEWQIVIKLPYASLGNKRVKKMADLDSHWYTMKMFISLIQACGRCTRSQEDTSITYILDGLSLKTIVKNKDILPKYFIDRIM